MIFRVAPALFLFGVFSSMIPQQTISRANPSDPAHPFNTPGPVSRPATDIQFETWRRQIEEALFVPKTQPALAAKQYGSFSPAEGVVAERVTYATQFGMRIPAIVYRPQRAEGSLPGIVVVNGHGGDKTLWYSFYSGILFARAGAVVVTYDPVGEDERADTHQPDAREHDIAIHGPHTPARMGGEMIADLMQGVSYLRSRKDVDPKRIAVLGYSMGSFVTALTGAVDPRIGFIVLSGGGNLDGNGGTWDSSAKIMCQGGPYQALSFLPDKAAILMALNQRRGPMLVMNGREDKMVAAPHNFEGFFNDLQSRAAALTGTRRDLFQYTFIENAGHRPSWVTKQGALWLESQLHFPNWSAQKIEAMPVIRIADWAAKTGAHINNGFENPLSEGGIPALDDNIPNLTPDRLNAVPLPQWQREKDQFVWSAWVRHALMADGLQGQALSAAMEPVKKVEQAK